MTRRDVTTLANLAVGYTAATFGVAATIVILLIIFCWWTVFPSIGVLWLAGIL